MTSRATVACVIRAGIERDALEPLLREADKLASHLGGQPGPGSLRQVAAVASALSNELLVHLENEERDVYPVVFGDELRPAVDMLVLDHEAIRGAVRRLESAIELARATDFEHCEPVARALGALVVLVRAHHAKEGYLYVRTMATPDDL
ncbi:MAG TPA: hemerythrin domain-containing protein [Acidimicrobiales bacterium]|jgi:hemerythrin-like domain-containing protein|nr:hemerythrin domain-containing protein [Acidimicrobiales bacterium]